MGIGCHSEPTSFELMPCLISTLSTPLGYPRQRSWCPAPTTPLHRKLFQDLLSPDEPTIRTRPQIGFPPDVLDATESPGFTAMQLLRVMGRFCQDDVSRVGYFGLRRARRRRRRSCLRRRTIGKMK
ncbi:hypothetical protein JAAARDRAFT_412775 [Jaapia argillacea MUCL 33604]|uniref:Uncharacterized protein n=1 Tax=Jaapia argillacea MUCL 33604 TaxID=933084 RepID=A0A067PH54_9AGAM|nr:hypothetical protein JAAARDRAFT_412775 [Jaapia argillacea MUCL 33604]